MKQDGQTPTMTLNLYDDGRKKKPGIKYIEDDFIYMKCQELVN